MRDVDFDTLSAEELIDHTALSEAFKKYLMSVLEYDESEASFVIATDFQNPYDTPYVAQHFECKCTIDGKDYEVRACRTDFCLCGLFDLAEVQSFEFYMLFDLDTLSDQTVGAYQKARKMYLI